jgi:AcrR family transcriptional regulator
MARTLTETKKAAILRAAQRAFAVRDFHEVLTDDIAAEAGIGKGTIYRYFETKEDLYFATLVCGFEELHEVLRAALPHEKSPSRRLERIAEEILRIFCSCASTGIGSSTSWRRPCSRGSRRKSSGPSMSAWAPSCSWGWSVRPSSTGARPPNRPSSFDRSSSSSSTA